MARVLVTDRIQQAGLDILAQRSDIEIDCCQDRSSEEELIGRVETVDAILVGTTPITGRVIDAARVLKVVSRRGVGYDAIDMPALRRRRIPLAIVGSANASTVVPNLCPSFSLSALCPMRMMRPAPRIFARERINRLRRFGCESH
jgi:D-3-phosphoglycerate dehydrogenase / 2-oxoglutarate reductase